MCVPNIHLLHFCCVFLVSGFSTLFSAKNNYLLICIKRYGSRSGTIGYGSFRKSGVVIVVYHLWQLAWRSIEVWNAEHRQWVMSARIRASLFRIFSNGKALKPESVESLLTTRQIRSSHSSLLHQSRHAKNDTNRIPNSVSLLQYFKPYLCWFW